MSSVQQRLDFSSKRSVGSDGDLVSNKKSKCSPEKKNHSKDVLTRNTQQQDCIPNSISCTLSPDTKTTTPSTSSSSSSSSSTTFAETSTIPPPRWGHSLTPIQDDCVVLYGGQTVTSKDQVVATTTTTLSDVYVYNCQTKQFSKPIQCDGVERQWHSAAYLPQRQLMIAFGGEAPDEKGRLKTLNQVMVLDTEIMLWYVEKFSRGI
jgi:hypothetical protein